MKSRWLYTSILVILLSLALLTFSARAQEAAPGGYSLSWWTVDGGGGTSSATGYSLNGTAGQPDAGIHSGSGYLASGGYWTGAGAGVPSYPVFIPLIIH